MYSSETNLKFLKIKCNIYDGQNEFEKCYAYCPTFSLTKSAYLKIYPNSLHISL